MKSPASLGIDKQTHARLKKLAGDIPVARFLRELSKSLTGEIPDPIEKELKDINLEIKKLRVEIFGGLDRKNSKGEYVPVSCFSDSKGEIIPAIYSGQIQAALEENPDVKQVGWYDRDDAGMWVFSEKRFRAWKKARDDEFSDPALLEKRGKALDKWMAKQNLGDSRENGV